MTDYEAWEIVLVDFPQRGLTQTKKRPALVVLDIGDADVALAPITTKERLGSGDYKLKDWQSGGLLRT
ncbi:MAG: type II toxin-antitoxin system PemK/MazF family toxin [Acidobacteria bacterium]|nr:type II toxin-antitoxin system PemK/MazF family toxin [Acidobacteriota bacterium]MBI3658225.1 type II toxin-antitoxin system PemK/MazF family toxin [Acidobacteriota bacterium]